MWRAQLQCRAASGLPELPGLGSAALRQAELGWEVTEGGRWDLGKQEMPTHPSGRLQCPKLPLACLTSGLSLSFLLQLLPPQVSQSGCPHRPQVPGLLLWWSRGQAARSLEPTSAATYHTFIQQSCILHRVPGPGSMALGLVLGCRQAVGETAQTGLPSSGGSTLTGKPRLGEPRGGLSAVQRSGKASRRLAARSMVQSGMARATAPHPPWPPFWPTPELLPIKSRSSPSPMTTYLRASVFLIYRMDPMSHSVNWVIIYIRGAPLPTILLPTLC